MQFHFRSLLYLSLIVVLFSSCGGFEKIRKSNDVNYKLTKANEYFDKKQYQHANELYKELMPVMKSTRNYEALFYKYAYTFYYLKDYVEASYYFKNFTEYKGQIIAPMIPGIQFFMQFQNCGLHYLNCGIILQCILNILLAPHLGLV